MPVKELSRANARIALDKLKPFIAGIKDFNPATVKNEIPLNAAMMDALDDSINSLVNAGIIYGIDKCEIVLNLSELRLAAEREPLAASR